LEALGVVRDIAIVLLAIESLVVGVLLAILLGQLRALIRMLREDVEPLLDSAGDTARRVQGTVGLVTDTVVTPLVRVSSAVAGVREAINALIYFKRRKSPSADKPNESGAL